MTRCFASTSDRAADRVPLARPGIGRRKHPDCFTPPSAAVAPRALRVAASVDHPASGSPSSPKVYAQGPRRDVGARDVDVQCSAGPVPSMRRFLGAGGGEGEGLRVRFGSGVRICGGSATWCRGSGAKGKGADGRSPASSAFKSQLGAVCR